MSLVIKSAQYVVSSPDVAHCPSDGLAEYAFIGRSNVGKSSLINMLTQNQKLAQTSATPGKTRMINHFLINKSWFLVDLPGYGFARRSQDKVQGFSRMIREYLLMRQEMVLLFLLIDSRLEPQKIDLDFVRFLGENGVPFCLVFTKADKSSHSRVMSHVHMFLDALKEEWEELPQYFVTSSETGEGRDQVLDYIHSVNQSLKEES